jgi:hypothetical protein
MITEELKIALPRTGSVGRSHVVAERPLDLAVCSKHHSVLFDLNILALTVLTIFRESGE